jgi:hypothetical protein
LTKRSGAASAARRRSCRATAIRRSRAMSPKQQFVGWAKERSRRAHHQHCARHGGHASLCPPYGPTHFADVTQTARHRSRRASRKYRG